MKVKPLAAFALFVAQSAVLAWNVWLAVVTGQPVFVATSVFVGLMTLFVLLEILR